MDLFHKWQTVKKNSLQLKYLSVLTESAPGWFSLLLVLISAQVKRYSVSCMQGLITIFNHNFIHMLPIYQKWQPVHRYSWIFMDIHGYSRIFMDIRWTREILCTGEGSLSYDIHECLDSLEWSSFITGQLLNKNSLQLIIFSLFLFLHWNGPWRIQSAIGANIRTHWQYIEHKTRRGRPRW